MAVMLTPVASLSSYTLCFHEMPLRTAQSG
jgi:hypothetical protein